MNWLRKALGLCAGYAVALVIFAPMLAAIADLMLWLFGEPYRVVAWEADRVTFAVLWTLVLGGPGIALLIALQE